MGEKKKILLLGTNPFALNRGVTAMCMSSIEIIKKNIPESLLVIGGYSLEYGDLYASLYTQKYKNKDDIKIDVIESGFWDKIKRVKKILVVSKGLIKLNFTLDLCLLWKIFSYFGIETNKIFCKNKMFKQFYECDVVVDLKWGDQFADIYGLFNVFLWVNESLIPILLNKPYVLFPQTIGPFKNMFIKTIAKFILNNVKIIFVREKKSENTLLKMKISPKKIFLIPDTAFYLDPISEKEVNEILIQEGIDLNLSSPIIGIVLRYVGTAGQTGASHENYINIMVQFAEYIQKNYGCSILLIPHDGIKTSERVYKDFLTKMKNKNNIFYLKNRDYSTEELRGIIGKCDMTVSAYMHANIASLSMCVPTINFAYSYKAIGNFEVVGQEKYVLNLKDLTYENITSKFEDAWKNREKIRKELEARMPEIKKQLMFAGELVKRVLDEQKPK